MNILDELVHTTIRIETFGPDGAGAGTGFIMQFECPDGLHCPLLVTNKHVITGASTGRLTFTRQPFPGVGEPDYGKKHVVTIEQFQLRWTPHPNENVDLAAMPLADCLETVGEGEELFYRAFAPETIATEADFKEMSAVQEILMIGYPRGFWDPHNNLPMVRRGITATAPYLDFEGRPQFMVDVAVFNGSSGSPVVLFEKGLHIDKNGKGSLSGWRMKLIGILWGGPCYSAEGTVDAEPIPTGLTSKTTTLMNLGYCVRADQLSWFRDHFTSLVAQRMSVGSSAA